MDPIAEQFAFVSVYNYAENEPISNIDLWGLQKWPSFFKNYVKQHIDYATGTNIPVSSEESNTPVTFVKIEVRVKGDVEVGAAVRGNVTLFGVKGKAELDAGSIKVAGFQIGSDNQSAYIYDGDGNYVMERDFELSVDLPGRLEKIGATIHQEQTHFNGQVIDDKLVAMLGYKKGNVIRGLSYGYEQGENATDVQTTKFNVGLGGQVIIGGNIDLEIRILTSTDPQKLYGEQND